MVPDKQAVDSNGTTLISNLTKTKAFTIENILCIIVTRPTNAMDEDIIIKSC